VFQEVTHDEGIKFLYIQSLVGDRSDNIFGVQGIGPVKAAKALDGLLPEEYYDKCKSMYDDEERFHLNMKLLYIWQKPNDIWQPPTTAKQNISEERTPTGTNPTEQHNTTTEGGNA
jgi:5'-3' exonuclease